MVQPESKTKIKLLRDVVVPTVKEGKLDWSGDIKREGTVVEVDELAAKELCDVSFDAPPQFRGERETSDPSATRHKIFRAQRL